MTARRRMDAAAGQVGSADGVSWVTRALRVRLARSQASPSELSERYSLKEREQWVGTVLVADALRSG